MAVKGKVSVIPTFVRGSGYAWPKDKKIFRPYPVSVYFGKPVSYADNLTREELTEHVVEQILKLESNAM